MATPDVNTSGFLRAVGNLLSGAIHVQDLCAVLIVDALGSAFRGIAKDYALNYADLERKYTDASLAACLGDRGETCKGVTRQGKPCSRRACVKEYCYVHRAQGSERDAKRRRVEAYADALSRRRYDLAVDMAAFLEDEKPVGLPRKSSFDLL